MGFRSYIREFLGAILMLFRPCFRSNVRPFFGVPVLYVLGTKLGGVLLLRMREMMWYFVIADALESHAARACLSQF